MSEEEITVQDVYGETVVLESDWGVQAQRACEKHLEACVEFMYAEEESDLDALAALGDSPSVGAFDGCPTCEVRETLFAAMPFFEAGLARDEGRSGNPIVFNLLPCPNQEVASDG